ncbi:hypothetical protein T484DRAFT_1758567 [Baffinella frigidus]|nr:hypothetical protein T484DRAFT_1758567 [Cryptophyta sp. CCMP2293]
MEQVVSQMKFERCVSNGHIDSSLHRLVIVVESMLHTSITIDRHEVYQLWSDIRAVLNRSTFPMSFNTCTDFLESDIFIPYLDTRMLDNGYVPVPDDDMSMSLAKLTRLRLVSRVLAIQTGDMHHDVEQLNRFHRETPGHTNRPMYIAWRSLTASVDQLDTSVSGEANVIQAMCCRILTSSVFQPEMDQLEHEEFAEQSHQFSTLVRNAAMRVTHHSSRGPPSRILDRSVMHSIHDSIRGDHWHPPRTHSQRFDPRVMDFIEHSM